MPANYLIQETSPYLLHHAHNPVEWYPWGDEAFGQAKEKNMPILLSIGYSACHWCHVMARESFENEKIAALMNEHFINIKVDREERPDLDEVYMNVVQMLTGRGGWPMTVFLTPEGKPFYGGTYFPPEDRYGAPGFPRVLQAVVQVYKDKSEEVEKNVEQIVHALDRLGNFEESDRRFDQETIIHASAKIARAYDPEFGGLGRAPKFPNSGVFDLFLRTYRRTGEKRFLEIVTHTLTRMAEGGIYDHLGGGFHRYSVDEKWLVPHFEKMLYDNAQLLRIFVEAFRITGDPCFKRVVEDTSNYLLREMLQAEGGFYSTQDADSEGVEGKYYLWGREEVLQLLGEESGNIFCRLFDISAMGNFEGKNILHPILSLEQADKYFKKSAGKIEEIVAHSKTKLLQEREKRIKPFLDEKILTSWNGLVLSGLAEAYKITGDPRYREAAERTVGFIFSKMYPDGILLHTYKNAQARIRAYLDDYAFLAAGLLDLYEATYEKSLLTRAVRLCETMVSEFWDEAGGAFFYTGKFNEQLISHTKPAFDSSVPSGNSVATQVLLRTFHFTGKEDYLRRAEKVLRLFHQSMEKQPFSCSGMICALDFYLEKPMDIVLVGDAETMAKKELLERIQGFYLPNKTLQVVPSAEPLGSISPLLEGKTQLDGKPTVYVCRNFTCSSPVTQWEELRKLLES